MTSAPLIAFRNGDWVPHQELSIGLNDLGFRQGVTAVERLRTYRGRPFRLDAHLERWTRTLTALRVAHHMTDVDPGELTRQLLDRNHDFVKKETDVGVTWLATPGEATAGDAFATPTLLLHLQCLPHETTRRYVEHGQPLVVTSVQQPPSESWSRQIKVRSRLHYYLADAECVQMHQDASGVLIDQDGSITETSISNVAVFDGESIVSPPGDQVLPGVTQQFVESIAQDLGIPWQRRRITPDAFQLADAVLLMGTDHGLWWCCQVFGSPSKKRHSVFDRLRLEFDLRTIESQGD